MSVKLDDYRVQMFAGVPTSTANCVALSSATDSLTDIYINRAGADVVDFMLFVHPYAATNPFQTMVVKHGDSTSHSSCTAVATSGTDFTLNTNYPTTARWYCHRLRVNCKGLGEYIHLGFAGANSSATWFATALLGRLPEACSGTNFATPADAGGASDATAFASFTSFGGVSNYEAF